MSLMTGHFVMFAATGQEGKNYFDINMDHLQFIKKNISPYIYINVFGAVFALNHNRSYAHVQSQTGCATTGFHKKLLKIIAASFFLLLP